MTYPICGKCGSTNIVADAWAEWDSEAGDWSLRTVFDHTQCDDCASTDVEWKDGDPPEEEDDGDEDGTSGQDRDSYSDTQDRDSYSTEDE